LFCPIEKVINRVIIKIAGHLLNLVRRAYDAEAYIGQMLREKPFVLMFNGVEIYLIKSRRFLNFSISLFDIQVVYNINKQGKMERKKPKNQQEEEFSDAMAEFDEDYEQSIHNYAKSIDDLADTIQELAVIFAKIFRTPEQHKILKMINNFKCQKINGFWISEIKVSCYKKVDPSFLDKELI